MGRRVVGSGGLRDCRLGYACRVDPSAGRSAWATSARHPTSLNRRDSRSSQAQGIPFKSGARSDCLGNPPAICINAITSTPANPPPMNAAITHQNETIKPPLSDDRQKQGSLIPTLSGRGDYHNQPESETVVGRPLTGCRRLLRPVEIPVPRDAMYPNLDGFAAGHRQCGDGIVRTRSATLDHPAPIGFFAIDTPQ
jgi:hypothetical protein